MYFKLFLSLLLIDLKLRIQGFNKTFNSIVNRKKTNKNNIRFLTEPDVLTILKKIDKVCATYPFKAECLHRTLLGYQILKNKYGIEVECFIGVKRLPFSSHAWLEFDGNVINDSYEFIKQFKIIMTSKKKRVG